MDQRVEVLKSVNDLELCNVPVLYYMALEIINCSVPPYLCNSTTCVYYIFGCCPPDAIFGDPHGGPREKGEVKDLTQHELRSVERRYSETPERLAVGLLLLLFTSDQLKRGNCTKPVRKDIDQLDPDRVWAIKCKYACN